MLDIHMFSAADKVAGQGVGAVYVELLGLLKKNIFPPNSTWPLTIIPLA